MAVELRYPVYIELLTKDRGFFAGSTKALQMIQALTGQYGKLFAAARKVESSSKYFDAVQASMVGVKTAAAEARVAIVGLAGSFAAFESGKAIIKGTVGDIKDAAKLQEQSAMLRAAGVSRKSVTGAQRYALTSAFSLPGATPAQTVKEIGSLRTLVGSTATAEKFFPTVARMAFLMGRGGKPDYAAANQAVVATEPFMKGKHIGSPAYLARLEWLVSQVQAATQLTGVNFSRIMLQIGEHSHGLAPITSRTGFLREIALGRALGSRAGSLGPALGMIGGMLGGNIKSGMLPLLVQAGLAKISPISRAQVLAGKSPISLLHSKAGLSDPAGWLLNTFIPHMRKLEVSLGYDPNKISSTTKFFQHISPGAHVSSVLSALIARYPQMEKFIKQMQEAGTLRERVAKAQKSLNKQLEIFHARLESLRTALGMPFLAALTTGLTNLNNALGSLGKWVTAHPLAAKFIAWTAALGSLVLIGGGIMGMAKWGLRLANTLGKLSSSIDAMNNLTKAAGGIVPIAEDATVAVSAFSKGLGLLSLALKGLMAFSLFKDLLGTSPTAKIAGQTPVYSKVQANQKGLSAIRAYNALSTSRRAAIALAAQRIGMPLNLAVSQLYTESAFNPLATSSKGAEGVGQIMPGTAAQYGIKGNLHGFYTGVYGWSTIMGALHKKTGAWIPALAAYNAGLGNMAAGATYAKDISMGAGFMGSAEHFGTAIHSGLGQTIVINGPIHIHAATKDIHEALTKGVKRALQASTHAGGSGLSGVQTGGHS